MDQIKSLALIILQYHVFGKQLMETDIVKVQIYIRLVVQIY